MARLLYGCTAADYTITSGGRVIPNTELTVWDAIEGGTQITDLTDYDGNAVGTVTSEGTGFVRFYGPDGETDNLWLDSGQNSRVLVRPTVITADLGDGSILDEDINAAADIARSKIAGTALTSASTDIFSVLDYGAVGDGVTDDTAAVNALLSTLDGRTVPGGHVLFPGGHTYRIDGTIVIKSGATVEIRGGATCSRLTALTNATVPMFQITGEINARLVGDGYVRTENASPNGVIALGPIDPDTEDVRVFGAKVDGLSLWGVKAEGNVGVALKSSNDLNPNSGMYENVVSNLRLHQFGTGVWLSKGANANEFRNICFFNMLDYAYDLYGNGTHETYFHVAQNRIFGGFVDQSPDCNPIRMRKAATNYVIGFGAEPGWQAPYDQQPFTMDADCIDNFILMEKQMPNDGIDLGENNVTIVNGVFTVPSPVTAGGFGHVLGPTDTAGAGSPEGVLAAPIGSTFRRTDGGAGTGFYVKESGAGDTGWVAKGGTGPIEMSVGTVTAGSPALTMTGDETDGYVMNFVLPGTNSGNLLTANQASGTDTLSDTTGWSGYNATVWSSTAQAKSGTRSLGVATTTTGAAYLLAAARVAVTAGQPYTLQAWVRTDQASGETFCASIDFYAASSGGSSLGSNTSAAVALTDSAWALVTVTLFAPAGTNYVEFYFYRPSPGANEASIWVDEITLHAGAGGTWAMPGVPITGTGIRANPSNTAQIQAWNPVTAAWVTVS